MRREIAEKLDLMVRILVERFRPFQVILFGSHAHGTETPDSDVDLLVVLNEVESKRKAAVQMYEALADSGISKDIIVTTVDEIQKLRDQPGSLIMPALREGKVLYGPEE